MQIKIKGLQGQREYRPNWKHGAIIVPANSEITLSEELSKELEKCKTDLEFIQKFHAVTFINQKFQHTEETKIEKPVVDESAESFEALEKKALNSALPQISRATKAEQIERFLDSEYEKVRNAAQKKLAKLKGE